MRDGEIRNWVVREDKKEREQDTRDAPNCLQCGEKLRPFSIWNYYCVKCKKEVGRELFQ